jgi:hypothetical protein
MIARRRRRVPAFRALATPWLLGIALAFTVALGLLHDVANVLRRSSSLDARAAAARAQLVADAAAIAHGDETVPTRTEAGGIAATVVRDAGVLRVETADARGTTHRFVAPQLGGAAAAAFALPFTAASSVAGATRLPFDELPRLDPTQLQRAVRADSTRVLRREPGVALLHWEAGTDADDFVFAERAGVDLAEAGELLLVPGHLWVPPGERPLELALSRDCVLVVHGNVYLGRSLRVRGARLVIATVVADGAVAFADRDANGRWSCGDRLLSAPGFHGWIEGAGSAWCGLPTAGPVECDAALVVAGELHVAADTGVRGPLVLANGVTRCARMAQLRARGAWAFAPERERVPGFATRGDARPGLLRASAAAADEPAKQTLYVARLGR